MSGAPAAGGSRFGGGDGLRAIAALSVLAHHAGRSTGVREGQFGDPFNVFGDVGGHLVFGLQVGLFIFFALSGYLLGRPFARAIVNGTKLPSLPRYAKARFLRIVPAFWAVWTVTLLLRGTHGAGVGDLIAFYGFGQVYDPHPAAALMVQAWTLDVEMAFYIFLPLAALALWYLIPRLPRTFSRGTWLLIAVGVGAVASLAFRAVWANPAWKSTLPEYLVAFAPGLALAVGEQLWAQRARGSDAVRRMVPALLVLAAGAAVWHAWAPPRSFVAQTLSGALTGGFVVAAALMYEWSTGKAWRPLAHPVAVWLGERSYGIYLVHMLVLFYVTSAGDEIASPWAAYAWRIALCAVGSVVAAAVLFRLVERPAMRLRARGPAPSKRPPTQPEMIAP